MKKQFIVILLCYAVNGIFPWSAVLFRPRDDIKAYLIRMIKEERKSIDGAMYMLTDKDVAQALVDAYVRGVKVRLVLDQISMGEKYGKGLFLQQSGIEVFVHAVPNINVFLLPIMHHKFFIFGSLLPMLNWILAKKTPSLHINFKMVEVSGYLGYYVAGYYFSKYEVGKKTRYLLYFLGIISLLATVVCTYILSINSNKFNEFFYQYSLPNTMFVAYAVFLLVKKCIEKIDFREKTINTIQYISNCTFGIYLVHDFFISFSMSLKIGTLSFTPILSVPSLSFAYYFLSFILVVGIKQIPKLNKLIL